MSVPVALFAGATRAATPRDVCTSYGASYRQFDLPAIGAGSFFTVGDALPDGRLLAATGDGVYLETAIGSGAFDLVSTIAPGVFVSAPDPAFLRVSPDGSRIAFGGGAGRPLVIFDPSDLGSAVTPSIIDASVAQVFATVSHFDAAWMDGDHLAVTSNDGGSRVTLLDVTSDTLAPVNPTIIANIDGASGGIVFDSAGRLYTGNGFDLDGGTGTLKAFSPGDWSVGSPADFASDGVLIGDVLSAYSLSIDLDGDLIVGGGDFFEGETGYLAVICAQAVESALLGFGPIDINNPAIFNRLDPAGTGDRFYGSSFNRATGELYVTDGVRWYATVPAPASAMLLTIPACNVFRRRRRSRGMVGGRRLAGLTACAFAGSALGSSEFATEVIDYTPAPGFYINDSLFNDPAMALGPPVGGATDDPTNTNAKIVSLGGFGGSITLGFDHMVLDHPANPFGMDAIVFSNAFWAGTDPTQRWAEAAHIEISLDANSNGIADDTWYLIQGSSLPAPASGVWREQDWDDDPQTMTPPDVIDDYPDPMIYPNIGSMYTTGAYELPSEFAAVVLVNPNGSGATQEAHWGYADLSPTLAKPSSESTGSFYTRPDDPMTVGITPGSGGGDAFDIAWAIDPVTGNPAQLAGFHFIRITTAVQFETQQFYEISAEIGGVADVRPVILLGDLNEDGYINTADLGILLAAFGTADAIADLNGDGIVDSADLGILLSLFNGDP
ncbi:MAG: hypothetical protein H6814_04225 [Phycisphaeraceae bacterium]|nr:hypothetical protein [Phycisphaeraceae bacterium]